MNSLNIKEVCDYLNENIKAFYQRRIEITRNLKLNQLIGKNPYLHQVAT